MNGRIYPEFRKRHLKALAGLFVEALQLCRKVGLVKLGHVSLDGTKVKANASKHKAMSYGRMEKKAEELEAEVKRLLAQAQSVDDAEDVKYGKGKRGDEVPEELRFKQERLKKIKEAMKSLEAEAKAKADAKREEIRQKEQALLREGKKRKGKKSKEPSDKSEPVNHLYNITDGESAGPGYLRKNTFSRHYAIAHLFKNLASTMALLSKLRDFKLSTLAELKFSADFKSQKFYPFGRDVLGETARTNLGALLNHLID